MKQIVLTNDKGQYNNILESGLYYAWCNAINQKMIEAQKNIANLVIIEPHESKTHEYYYFFDIRDCMGVEVAQYDRTKVEDTLFFSVRELLDAKARIKGMYDSFTTYVDPNEISDELAERLDRLCDRLEKVTDQIDDVWMELYEKAKAKKEQEGK